MKVKTSNIFINGSHNKTVWSKFCTDAGFLTKVEVRQYFMTMDIEEFSQFTEPVACREYTLPRDAKTSDSKGWIRVNTKIGPVSEVTTSYLQCKYGVEIRIESVNRQCLLVGQNFSWLEWVGHGLEQQQGERQQRAGNLWNVFGSIRVEDECCSFCEPIKG